MTVLFMPDYSEDNPYQRNLAGGLAEDVTYGDEDSRLPVVAALWREDISVVHVHWLNIFFNGEGYREKAVGFGLLLVRLLAIRLAGVPVVWTVHNATTHDREHPWLERRFKRWFVTSGPCDRLIVHCEAVADELIETVDLPPSARERIDVIPHGHYLDNYPAEMSQREARESLGIDESDTVFLFFGMIRRYKGVPDLVDAYEAASLPESTLLIAGNPDTEALQAELDRKTAGATDIVTAYEFITSEEIQRYMNAADAVVLPFRRITTSGTAILAMTFGKPLVVPPLGCLPKLLTEAGAIFYDRSERDGLARALEDAAEADLAAMGAANRRRVERYDWESIASKTAAAYARAHGIEVTGPRDGSDVTAASDA